MGSKKSWANNDQSNPPDSSPWIQIDLGKEMSVTGIIAQGYRGTGGNYRWVRNFKFRFGFASGSLDYIKDSKGQVMVSIIIHVYLCQSNT